MTFDLARRSPPHAEGELEISFRFRDCSSSALSTAHAEAGRQTADLANGEIETVQTGRHASSNPRG